MKHSATLRIGVILTFLTMTVVPIVPAAADTTTTTDANDSDGKLDVREVVQSHRKVAGTNQRLLTYRIKTYEAWAFEDWGALTGVALAFNTDADKRSDRSLSIRVDQSDGTPYAEMTNPDTGRIFGYARVSHPKPRVLRIEFPRRLLGKRVHGYRWGGTSSYFDADDAKCGKPIGDISTPCRDDFPDTGTVKHSLR